MSYMPVTGDIILENSNKTGAKIVKFFMQSPTCYQQLWRWFNKSLTSVPYYHVAMIINDGFNGHSGLADIVEQQWKVRLEDWNPTSDQIIFRRVDLTSVQASTLRIVALTDMDEKWDILNAIGKFLTWLTCIPLFAMFMQWPTQEICVCRVASWYERVLRERFGCLTHSEITTQRLYEYLMTSSKYQCVYRYNNGIILE